MDARTIFVDNYLIFNEFFEKDRDGVCIDAQYPSIEAGYSALLWPLFIKNAHARML